MKTSVRMASPDLVQVRADPKAAVTTRLHYIDWLRVLAVLGVFLYHSLQPFSTHEWHVKNNQLSRSIDAVVSFVDPWGVAFFFLIAGGSSFLALRRRTAGQYVQERLQRLLLPLTVAYLLLSPVQSFIEERHFGRYTGSFIAGLPLFFKQVYSELPSTLRHPLLVDKTYHLWFVVFLLWFALLGLPLCIWLRSGGRALVAWLRVKTRPRGATLLFGVPLMFVPLVVLPLFPGAEDWGTFAYLFGFFLAGHVLMSDALIMERVGRDLGLALFVAIFVDVAVVLTGVPRFIAAWQAAPAYTWEYAWSYLLVGVQAWAWVNFLLGLGMRIHWFQRPLPHPIAAGAMPFFLVHQPVILAIAFFIVRLDTAIVVKWMVIGLCSFLLSALLATALARLPLLSTLFGVKPEARSTAPQRIRSR